MKRVARFVIRLYPADWRKRYGDEFAALIDDTPTSMGSNLDLLKGAMKMRLAIPSFPKLAVLLCIAGVLGGLSVSFIVTPQYVSTATLLFESSPGISRASLRPDMSFVPQVLSRTSLSSVIANLNLYPEERTKMPLEDVIERMRTRDIQLSTVAMGPIALTISFTYRNRQKARDVVQVMTSKFVQATLTRAIAVPRISQAFSGDELARIEARLSAIEKRIGMPSPAPSGPLTAITGNTQVEVLDPPSLPVSPVYPDRYRFMAFGFAVGFVLAAIIAIFRRRVQPATPFPAVSA